MTTREQIAEEIAEKVYNAMNGRVWASTGPYDKLKDIDKRPYPAAARAILAIREIKEGQELWEKRDRLVELCPDKRLPDCRFIKPDNYMENAEKMKANCPCIRAGFGRVKVKG